MVVVVAAKVAVDAVSHIEVILSTFLAELRGDRHAVDSGTAIVMLVALVSEAGHVVIPGGVLDTDNPESVIVLGIHADLRDLVNVNDRDVEHRPAFGERGKSGSDDIVLTFERGVNLSVRRIERHRSKMSLDPVY